jgi:ribonucleoside-triphosphate reductase
MITTIRKRNGTLADYDNMKIANAIFKAAKATGSSDFSRAHELAGRVEQQIGKRFHSNSIPAVEEIQDLVEQVLIDAGLAAIAKAYILYREQHRRNRAAENLLIDINRTVDGYLRQEDWRVKENANVGFSLGGLILHNSGAVTANYWLENVYSRSVADAHRNGDFHIHDLCMFSGYCAGWSLRQLIAEGLGGVPNKISSGPARHLSTLVQQMVNFLGVLQNEWAGAQAFSSFDTYLAPFVKIDNLSYLEVKQCMQSFIFGVNTPSRWGSQAPFTNITLDWTVPPDLADEPAIAGGKPLDFTYAECRAEMDLINRAFLEVLREGDHEGRGFAYPIPTINITPDFEWSHPNTALLFAITGKYGTPYFQNFINSDLKPNDVRSMCCRLQLDKRALRNRGGGLFGSDEFTGSIGVVTINLPRIGYHAATEEEFLGRLDHLMDLARDSLETKRTVVTRLMDEGLFPYTRRYLRHWNNHFSTIGLIGMNEAALNFMGRGLLDADARRFAESMLGHMRERLIRYQEETGNLYNLEATPGEGTSHRLARIDREKFPRMVIPGGDAPYYTNSTQLPADATDDLFGALDMQHSLQRLYTGGTVFHAFVGESIDDPATCGQLVKTIAENYRIPYFTITPTFSICREHGYLRGEQYVCAACNQETEVYSRIVGYYRPVKNWNNGKKAEFGVRKEFSLQGVLAEGAPEAAREPACPVA